MAFSDPLPITINGVTKNLVRIDSGKYTSEYYLGESTQAFSAVIRSSDMKVEADGRRKVRHNVSIRQTVYGVPGVSAELTRQASCTIEHYKGDDVTAFDDIAIACGGLMTVANVAKLNNYES